MGYANCIGRVGALAVALGIGVALVGSGPGLAWAQDDGDPGSQSQDSPSVDAPVDEHTDTLGNDSPGGGNGNGTPSTPDVQVEPSETGTTGLTTTTTAGDAPAVTISSSGGSLNSGFFKRLLGVADAPAAESQAPQALETAPAPVEFRQAAQPAAFAPAADEPAALVEPAPAPSLIPHWPLVTVPYGEKDNAEFTRWIYRAFMPGLFGEKDQLPINDLEKMLFPILRSKAEKEADVAGVDRPFTEAEATKWSRDQYANLWPDLFGANGRSPLNDMFFYEWPTHDEHGHEPGGEDPGGEDPHEGHGLNALAADVQPQAAQPLTLLDYLLKGPRGHQQDMEMTRLLYQTVMPDVFGAPNSTQNRMTNTLWPASHEGHGGDGGGGHGSHGGGGGGDAMGMECMAGMIMEGCSSNAPTSAFSAYGDIKPVQAPGHAGHDMGSMSMPGHDMGATEAAPGGHAGHDMGAAAPGQDMPAGHAGHDMGSMPAAGGGHAGHDMGSMPAAGGGHAGHDMPAAGGGHAGHDMPAGQTPTVGGLLASQDGFTLQPQGSELGDKFAFTITGPNGAPVEDYEILHDRELHLIVASRDLQHYAHVHPTRNDQGQWSVGLPDLPAGAYRVFADFKPAGAQQYTLGIDATRPGAAPGAAPLVPKAADVVDGLDVTLDNLGDTATVTVRRAGQIVTTEPYLGAAGHLVALRDGDLAYLHVHPLDDKPNGPVRFVVDLPSAGTYALFFDFKVDEVVRTARFIIESTQASAGTPGSATAPGNVSPGNPSPVPPGHTGGHPHP